MTVTPDIAKPAARPRRRTDGNIRDTRRALLLLDEWEHFHDNLGWGTEEFARHFKYTPFGLLKVIRALKIPNDPRVRSFEAAWTREHPALIQPSLPPEKARSLP